MLSGMTTAELAVMLIVFVMQFSAVAFLIWAVFRIPVQAEPPVNRQIAMALGLHSRQTIFEIPILSQLLGFCVLLASRFPFFRDTIRADLEASGNPNGYSTDEYLALCIAVGLIMTGLSVGLVMMMGQFSFLFLFVMPILGFWLTKVALKEAASKRMRAIAKKVPYTLDLIALLMEAGGTFTEAIDTIVRDEPTDEFNLELRLVQSEIGFGATRAIALQNMADRIPIESLRSVVGAINQAEALGTPLSTILKNQSGMIRMMRSVRAEEASASASMRILIPSMLILIAVVLVVFSPMIFAWMEDRIMAP